MKNTQTRSINTDEQQTLTLFRQLSSAQQAQVLSAMIKTSTKVLNGL